jgi:hypothetical protein
VPDKRPPWWRRIFRRRPKAFAAGERRASMGPARVSRPTRTRATFVIRWVLTGLVALGLIGSVAIPSVRNVALGALSSGLDQVRRVVAPRLEPETPVSAEAADQLDDHPVADLFDRRRFTAWEAAGEAPVATATFAKPVDLGAVILHPGLEDGFLDLRRPARIELAFPDGTTVAFNLEDVPDLQRFDLNVSGVQTVEIRIVETKGPPGAPVAFAEIEFFTKN